MLYLLFSLNKSYSCLIAEDREVLNAKLSTLTSGKGGKSKATNPVEAATSSKDGMSNKRTLRRSANSSKEPSAQPSKSSSPTPDEV